MENPIFIIIYFKLNLFLKIIDFPYPFSIPIFHTYFPYLFLYYILYYIIHFFIINVIKIILYTTKNIFKDPQNYLKILKMYAK